MTLPTTAASIFCLLFSAFSKLANLLSNVLDNRNQKTSRIPFLLASIAKLRARFTIFRLGPPIILSQLRKNCGALLVVRYPEDLIER